MYGLLTFRAATVYFEKFSAPLKKKIKRFKKKKAICGTQHPTVIG